MTVYNIDFSESERKEFEELALEFRRQENEARNDYITRNARIQEQQRKAFAEFFDRMYAARSTVKDTWFGSFDFSIKDAQGDIINPSAFVDNANGEKIIGGYVLPVASDKIVHDETDHSHTENDIPRDKAKHMLPAHQFLMNNLSEKDYQDSISSGNDG